MTSDAIVSIDLTALVCITVSLGHMLIDPSLDGAMAIVYGVREAVAVDNRNGSATARATRQLKRLLRREIASRYRTFTVDGSLGSPETSHGRVFDEGGPCDVCDWIGRGRHGSKTARVLRTYLQSLLKRGQSANN